MKYGMRYNYNTGEEDLSIVRSFSDGHWVSIAEKNAKGIRTDWLPFPKQKVFISFCESNRKLMEILYAHLVASELLQPIIVEAKRRPNVDLARLVAQEIEDAAYFVAILTEKSMSTQWVNQEIGFAYGSRHLEDKRFAIVEEKILHKLRGFIHDKQQQPYLFNPNKRDQLNEYHNLCGALYDDVEVDVIEKFEIVPV